MDKKSVKICVIRILFTSPFAFTFAFCLLPFAFICVIRILFTSPFAFAFAFTFAFRFAFTFAFCLLPFAFIFAFELSALSFKLLPSGLSGLGVVMMTSRTNIFSFLTLIFLIFIFIQCEEQPAKPVYDNPLDELNPETGGDPFNLNAHISGGGITLNWTAILHEEISLTRIFRATDDGDYSTLFETDSIGIANFTDDDIANGHKYSYYVSVYGQAEEPISSVITVVEINSEPFLSIDDDNGLTSSRTVQLTILAFGADSMKIGSPDLDQADWIVYANSLTVILETGAGEKIVRAQFHYSGGEISTVISDTTAPKNMNPALLINNDDEYTGTSNVTLQLSAEGAQWVRFSNDIPPGTSAAAQENPLVKGINNIIESVADGTGDWIEFDDEIAWVLSPGEGFKRVYADFKNDFELIESASDTIIPLPIAGYFNIEHDSTYADQKEVWLYPSAEGENILCMFSQDPAFTGAQWADLTDSVEFELSSGEGMKTVFGRFKNDFDIIAAAADSILPLPMEPSITINRGAAYTINRDVWIYPLAAGTGLECKLSEDVNFTGVEWVACADSLPFELSAGNALKTVYAKFINCFEIECEAASESISPGPIDYSLTICHDSVYINYSAVSVSIAGDGAGEMKINTADDSSSIGWEPLQDEIQLEFSGPDGEQTVFGWFRNEFYTAPAFTDDIILDRECEIDTFYWQTGGGDTLITGDLIQFFLSAADDLIGTETGAEVTVELEGSFQDLQLSDNNNGTYTLDYYIQSNDFSDGGYFQAQLTDRAGNLAPTVSAAVPVTIMTFWETTYDNAGADDYGNCVEVVSGGGYIVAGQTIGAAESAYIVKTDGNGVMEWDTVLDYGDCNAHSIRQTFDGGFIVTGETDAGTGGMSDVLLVKIDASGIERWHRFFGGNLNDIGYSVLQAADGGFLVVGTTRSYGSGENDVWVIKTDSQGESVWDQTFGGGNSEFGYSVKNTMDGGYIIGGKLSAATFGYAVLYKIDANGNEEWTDSYLGGPSTAAYDVFETNDGGFVLTGEKLNGADTDIFLLRTNPLGSLLWVEEYGDNENDAGRGVIQTAGGGYMICGNTGTDLSLIKTDSYGTELNSEYFGGTGTETAQCIRQSLDGGIIVTGRTDSFGGGDSDIYLIKILP